MTEFIKHSSSRFKTHSWNVFKTKSCMRVKLHWRDHKQLVKWPSAVKFLLLIQHIIQIFRAWFDTAVVKSYLDDRRKSTRGRESGLSRERVTRVWECIFVCFRALRSQLQRGPAAYANLRGPQPLVPSRAQHTRASRAVPNRSPRAVT